jgi:hypothetical protein
LLCGSSGDNTAAVISEGGVPALYWGDDDKGYWADFGTPKAEESQIRELFGFRGACSVVLWCGDGVSEVDVVVCVVVC